MNAKEKHSTSNKTSLKPVNPGKPDISVCCDPDRCLRNPDKHRKNILDCLETARTRPRPPLNDEFICLLKLWRLIASRYTSEKIPDTDLEFLRWILQGRARRAIVYLRHQSDINVWYTLKAIERIANFNIPESNAMDNQIAMANWIWLKRELTGDLTNKSHVDIRKIRLDRLEKH